MICASQPFPVRLGLLVLKAGASYFLLINNHTESADRYCDSCLRLDRINLCGLAFCFVD